MQQNKETELQKVAFSYPRTLANVGVLKFIRPAQPLENVKRFGQLFAETGMMTLATQTEVLNKSCRAPVSLNVTS